MNNIIYFNDVILVMATAAPQQRCHICKCKVVDSKISDNCVQEFLNELPLLWINSLHIPEHNWCKVQFVDVSSTWKSYARHKQLWIFLRAHFIGYLCTRVTSAVSSASETSTTSWKRSASDSPLVSSTPRSFPPHERDPWLFRLTAMQVSFQRSLVFIDLEKNSTTVHHVPMGNRGCE